MANITVTINCEFSTYYQTNYPADSNTDQVQFDGAWKVFSGEQQIASNLQPNGISVSVKDLALDRKETGQSSQFSYTRRYYKYICEVSYPPNLYVINGTNSFSYGGLPYKVTEDFRSLSPMIPTTIADPNRGLIFKVWPEIGATNGHAVTYPTGIYAASRQPQSEVNAPLTHLIWDWGDGAVENVPLSATSDDRQGDYYYDLPTNQSYRLSVGNLLAPASHTFTPDENGNGTGAPISIVAVDSMGRRSAPFYSKIGPHLDVKTSIDETRNRIVFDTSGCYGRTERIVTEFYGSKYTPREVEQTPVVPDLDLDPNGKVWSFPLDLAGTFDRVAFVQDEDNGLNVGYSAFETEILNQPTGGHDDYRFERWGWQIERPPQSALALPDGATLLASEYENVIYAPDPPNEETPREPDTYRAQTRLRFILANKSLAPNFEDASAPRLFVGPDATIYLAGRAQSGATKLWRSTNRAQNWSEMSEIWTPEFYHADIVPLVNGAASIAIKRLDRGNNLYNVEFWFRKTFDLSNWESEPVKIDVTNNFGINLNKTLDETLRFYPLLINEALSGRPPRLIAFLGLFYSYRSTNFGATWEAFYEAL